jgi:hypothetical protein
MSKQNCQPKKYFGFYRGVVCANLSDGHCIVSVDGIINYSSDKDIHTVPPAKLAVPVYGGKDNDSGHFEYPSIGACVWVFFEEGDVRRPVVFAQDTTGTPGWSELYSSQGKPSPGNDLTTPPQPLSKKIQFAGAYIKIEKIPPKTQNNPTDNWCTRASINMEHPPGVNSVTTGHTTPFATQIVIDNIPDKDDPTNGSGGQVAISTGRKVLIKSPHIILDATNNDCTGKFDIYGDFVNINAVNKNSTGTLTIMADRVVEKRHTQYSETDTQVKVEI